MKRVLLAATLMSSTGCYNTQSVRVPLAGNPAGAECHARCAANRGDHGKYMACVATCPGAQRISSKCTKQDVPPYAVCEYQSDVSKIKTYGLVLLTGMLVVFAGGGA